MQWVQLFCCYWKHHWTYHFGMTCGMVGNLPCISRTFWKQHPYSCNCIPQNRRSHKGPNQTFRWVRGHSHVLAATYCLCFCSLVSNRGTDVTDRDPPHIQILPSEVFGMFLTAGLTCQWFPKWYFVVLSLLAYYLYVFCVIYAGQPGCSQLSIASIPTLNWEKHL